MAIDSVKLFKDGNGLRLKRHNVLLLHFHACSWNAPFGLSKIEFGPLGLAKIIGTKKRQDSDEQFAFCFEIALVVADRADRVENEPEVAEHLRPFSEPLQTDSQVCGVALKTTSM